MIRAVILALILLLGCAALLSADSQKPIYVLTIDNYIITPAVEEYIVSTIQRIEGSAQALIIQIDTPGGLLSSTRSIVKEIMNSPYPVVAYVAPSGARAGSAGVFITLASHIACMAPSTNIGAAHPVQIKERNSFYDVVKEIIRYIQRKSKQGEGSSSDAVTRDRDIHSEKIINDTTAWARSIASSRDRNVAWAKKAVTESISVTEAQALSEGIIDFVADDMDDLMKMLNNRVVGIDGRLHTISTDGTEIIRIDMSWRLRLLHAISNPSIAYILMMLGFYGLLFEFTHPGIGFPGIAGAISIILGFYGLHTLPTTYAGISLILLGIILFIAESRVVSFGLLTLGGVVCMFFGSVILIDTPYDFMRVSFKVIIPLVISTACLTVFLLGAVIRAHARKSVSGAEGLLGEYGNVIKDLAKQGTGHFSGKVFVHGEIWNVQSEAPIKKGAEIEIIGVKNTQLMVKKKEG